MLKSLSLSLTKPFDCLFMEVLGDEWVWVELKTLFDCLFMEVLDTKWTWVELTPKS